MKVIHLLEAFDLLASLLTKSVSQQFHKALPNTFQWKRWKSLGPSRAKKDQRVKIYF